VQVARLRADLDASRPAAAELRELITAALAERDVPSSGPAASEQ
jgi:hypothetical protein